MTPNTKFIAHWIGGFDVINKQLFMAVAASALVLGVSSARAADIEPVVQPPEWYVSLFGGLSWLDDVKTHYKYIGYEDDGTYHNSIQTDTGFIVGGALGTHLTDDLRAEIEAAYSENDVHKIKYDAPDGRNGSYDGHGHFGTLTFMANLWYDVPLSETVKPYIGGGAGVAIVDGKVGYNDSASFDPIFDDSSLEFAFQLGAGLRWQAWENVTLDIGYRLRGVDGPSFNSKTTAFQGTTDYDANWMWSHNLIAGISFGF
jgi:opacity protein-like surface antigen